MVTATILLDAAAFLALGAKLVGAQTPGPITLHKAQHHAMQYYLSLPAGWNTGRSWPVVVSIEDADRDFKRNADTFVKARGDMPFILVIPEVVTNGGPRYREAPGYTYHEADWDEVAKAGDWAFDDQGLAAVLSDVHRLYGGESRYFLTGWEAGAHTVFALAFNHPERLVAVAPVCPNYAARNVSFSSSKPSLTLSIRVFSGSSDPSWGPGKPLYVQARRAESEAGAHGMKFTYQTVRGKGHEPLATQVLEWFDSFLTGHAGSG